MQSNMTSSTDTMVNKTNLAPIFTVLILKQRDGSTGEHKCGLGYHWGKPGASGHRKGLHANLGKTMSHNNKIQCFYHCSPMESEKADMPRKNTMANKMRKILGRERNRHKGTIM